MTDAITVDQRYYASSYGRFLTADPYVAGGASAGNSSNPSDPGTWNRYAYVGGDPVHRFDPQGKDWCDPDSGNCFLGSAPGASPRCGGIYQNAAFAFGDFIGDPDAATYWAQLQATGCAGLPLIVPIYDYPTAGPSTPPTCAAVNGTPSSTEATQLAVLLG